MRWVLGRSWTSPFRLRRRSSSKSAAASFSRFGGQISTLGEERGNGTPDGTVTISVVPEPATWGMMLLGFAGLAFADYRGSRKGAAFAA